MAYTNTNTDREIENIAGDTPYLDVTGDMVGDRIYLDPNNTGGFQIGKTITTYSTDTATSGNKAGTWNQIDVTPSGNSSTFASAAVNMAKQKGSNVGGTIKGTEHYAIFEGTNGITGGVFGQTVFSSYRGTDPNNNNSSIDTQGIYIKADTRSGSNGDINYLLGANIISEASGSGDVEFMQGMHLNTRFNSGSVSGSANVLLLDSDGTSTDVQGDFAYLKIQNDGLPTIAGTSRAIDSSSLLPSVFGGSVQANSFVDSGVQEFTDNAAAIAGGLTAGTHYRTGDLLKIVH